MQLSKAKAAKYAQKLKAAIIAAGIRSRVNVMKRLKKEFPDECISIKTLDRLLSGKPHPFKPHTFAQVNRIFPTVPAP